MGPARGSRVPRGRLRIIAGVHRGRRIAVPRGLAVRPTPDRVREALFSILAERVDGARVLDAFAGTGALGLEALSRGAVHVTFIETDPRALAALRANIEGLAAGARCTVVHGPVETGLSDAPGGPFDLILADPPYATPPGEAFLRMAADRLARGGRVVVQRGRSAPPARGPLDLLQTRRYGRTSLDFFGFSGGSPGSPEPGSDPGSPQG